MTDNVLKSIDDVLIVNVVSKINGRIQFTNYSDVWVGVTDTRYVEKEYRISADGVWSDWLTLSINNLINGHYNVNGQITIQLRFTRSGEDTSGVLEFKSIDFQGITESIQFVAPTLFSSVFADIIGTDELHELEENLFKKLYYRGILPNYITRGDNFDTKEDADFVDVFYSIARYFAMIIRFFNRFENFSTDYELMRENVREYGLYFDESNITQQDLQYLSQHLYDEIQKRGTMMIYKRKGDVVNGRTLSIDGELIRLLRSTPSDELLCENIPIHKLGWCLGQCSPLYRGTAQAYNLNKTKENTQDFVDLNNYVITNTNRGKYELQTYDGKKVLRFYQSTSSSSVVGLGYNAVTLASIDNLIVVDSRMDYEITFAFQVVKSSSSNNQILFGVNGFDVLGNELNDAFITSDADQISNTFFLTKLSKWKMQNWYHARGIIRAYSSMNIDKDYTNLGYGTNLHFNNPFVKFILPKIQIIGTSIFDVKIWDYKIRPLIRGMNILPLKGGEENSHSLGFIQSQSIMYNYIRNNNNSQSKDEIIDIIERYLLPYNSVNMFVFMNN